MDRFSCKYWKTPVLYQHLTDRIFGALMHKHFEIQYLQQGITDTPTSNVAGYVCRHLPKQLEKENHELREELVLCLMELTRSKDDLCETDEEWTRKQDRGGLWYLKDTTFQLFCAIEYQVRAALTELKRPSPPSKAGIIKSVISDEDVQFYWLIASADFEIDDRETQEILLKKIVELFLTVREFSLTGV